MYVCMYVCMDLSDDLCAYVLRLLLIEDCLDLYESSSSLLPLPAAAYSSSSSPPVVEEECKRGFCIVRAVWKNPITRQTEFRLDPCGLDGCFPLIHFLKIFPGVFFTTALNSNLFLLKIRIC